MPKYLGHLSYLICHKGSCDLYNRRQKSFFWYNYVEAWYPPREPICINDVGVSFAVENEECAWVGPNHQKMCKPLTFPCQVTHISARNRWQAGKEVLEARKLVPYSVVARIFANGQILLYETTDICNPIRESCLGKFLKGT
jgi:hypothetical protein